MLRLSRGSFPFVINAFADSGYAGDREDVEIVKKPNERIGFAVRSGMS